MDWLKISQPNKRSPLPGNLDLSILIFAK